MADSVQHDGIHEAAEVGRVESNPQRSCAELLRRKIEKGIEADFTEIRRIEKLERPVQEIGRSERNVAGEEYARENARALELGSEVEGISRT